MLLNHLEDVPVPPGEQLMQHARASGAACYQYCCVCSAPRTAACTNYSAWSRKCVVAAAMGALRGSQHY